MQKKVTMTPQLKRLIQARRAAEDRYRKAYLTQCVLLFSFFVGGEYHDLSYSRILTLMLWMMIKGLYSRNMRFASHPVNRYKLERDFRIAAQEDDISGLVNFLQVFGTANANVCGDSLRNALHFAVKANALEAIHFLLAVDERNAQTSAEIPLLVTHQDKKGNTPIHEAILQVIEKQQNNETPNFKVLLMLCALDPESPSCQQQPGISVSQPIRKANPLIDVFIRNNNGETILDLMSKVEPVLGNNEYVISKEIIQRLAQQQSSEGSYQQQDPGPSTPSSSMLR